SWKARNSPSPCRDSQRTITYSRRAVTTATNSPASSGLRGVTSSPSPSASIHCQGPLETAIRTSSPSASMAAPLLGISISTSSPSTGKKRSSSTRTSTEAPAYWGEAPSGSSTPVEEPLSTDQNHKLSELSNKTVLSPPY